MEMQERNKFSVITGIGQYSWFFILAVMLIPCVKMGKALLCAPLQ